MSRSTNGGQTWTSVQQSAIQAGSVGEATSACNSYPGGVFVDQNGAHKGRVYLTWDTGDPPQNVGEGCNITSAAPFDHVFLSYSDDGGNTWTTHAVFNDPCAPSPPVVVDPTACQDTSEGWTPVAVDDAGNVYVAFTWLDLSQTHPEYDIYLEVSKDGGNTWDGGTSGPLGVGDAPGPPIRVSASTPGTNYYPTMAAGGTGGVEVAWYHTPYRTVTGTYNKPAAQPGSAVWDVVIGQDLDVLHDHTFTVSPVSTHHIYFGDICTVGIACGAQVPTTNWAIDRTLFDNFGMAVGPDGGARVTWTDAHDSWSNTCKPGGSDDSKVGCQTTHVFFACQSSGLGIHGETVTGCGQSTGPVVTPEAPLVPALLLGGGAAIAVSVWARRRRSAGDREDV